MQLGQRLCSLPLCETMKSRCTIHPFNIQCNPAAWVLRGKFSLSPWEGYILMQEMWALKLERKSILLLKHPYK